MLAQTIRGVTRPLARPWLTSLAHQPRMISSLPLNARVRQSVDVVAVRRMTISSTRMQSDTSSSPQSSGMVSTASGRVHGSSSTGGQDGQQAEQSRTQRLKALFRKHGWTALAVYLALSAIDFGLTFALIYAVGADRVRQAEDWVLDTLGWRRKDGEPGKFKKAVDDWKEQHPRKRSKKDSTEALEVTTTSVSPPSTKADDSGYSAMATTAALAYVIHKTALLPVRVGITVRHLAWA